MGPVGPVGPDVEGLLGFLGPEGPEEGPLAAVEINFITIIELTLFYIGVEKIKAAFWAAFFVNAFITSS